MRYILLEKGGRSRGRGRRGRIGRRRRAKRVAEADNAESAAEDGPEKARVQELVREIDGARLVLLGHRRPDLQERERGPGRFLAERAGHPLHPLQQPGHPRAQDHRARSWPSSASWTPRPTTCPSRPSSWGGAVPGSAWRRRTPPLRRGTWTGSCSESRRARTAPLYTAFRRALPGALGPLSSSPSSRAVGYYPLYDLVTQIYRGLRCLRPFPRGGGRPGQAPRGHQGLRRRRAATTSGSSSISRGDGEDGDSDWTIDVPSGDRRRQDHDHPQGQGPRLSRRHPAPVRRIMARPGLLSLSRGEEDGSPRLQDQQAALAEADPELLGALRRGQGAGRGRPAEHALRRADPGRKPSSTSSASRAEETKFPFDLLGDEPFASAEAHAADPARGAGRTSGAPSRRDRAAPPGRSSSRPIRRESLKLRQPSGGARWPTASWPGSNSSRAAGRSGLAAVVRDGSAVRSSKRRSGRRDRPAIWSAASRIRRSRPLFEPRPGRRVFREVDFCDAEGRAFRMDRVVVDPDAVTVVDYKTGADTDAGRRAPGRG